MEKNKFIVNFLLKEVILKYLFCYILSVITLSVPLILFVFGVSYYHPALCITFLLLFSFSTILQIYLSTY